MPNLILVFAEINEGKLTRAAWEALAAGQQMARELGMAVAAVVVGGDLAGAAAELTCAAVDEVLTVGAPALAAYTADGYAAALRTAIDQRHPQFVIFSHTYQVRDFVPKLAAGWGRAFASDCLAYRCEADKLILVRQVFQGKYSADVELAEDAPHFVSFQAGAFRADAVQRGASPAAVTPMPVSINTEAIRVMPEARFREARQSVDLTQAEKIVAVGRGMKSQENIALAQSLAEALGAELAASRPICDSGWLPMDRQIGSSGQTVAPKLYVALGISGAIQHMMGMKGSRTVVAINKDREAPIFEAATYGIVGDIFEVVPALIEEIRKAKGL